MNESEKKTGKTRFPAAARIIAVLLVVLLAGEIVLSSFAAVHFSSGDYEGSEYEQAAEYIADNDDYLNAGSISRMRAVASLLREPKTFDQYSLFASVAIADEDYAKAAEYLLNGIDMYEGDEAGLSDIYTKIGCLRALDGGWSAADALFEKALALNAANSGAWLMLCETNLNLKNYEKALTALETYATLTELSAEEFDALVQLKINLEQYDEALALCENAETDGRITAADAALYRAQAYYMKGDYAKAVEQAELCRSKGGDPVKAGSLIALCGDAAGDYEAALNAYRSLIDAGQADLSIYQQAAQDAYLIDDLESTLRLSEEALEKFGDTEDTLVFKKWLGIAYFETGEMEKAEPYLTAILDSGDSTPELYYLRGICEMGSEKYEQAVSDFTQSLSAEELMDKALYNRGLCYLQLGNNDAAAADFQEAIDRNADEDVIALICELLEISPDQLA